MIVEDLRRGACGHLAVGVREADAIPAVYGQAVCDSGQSLRDCLETLSAIVDGQRSWRREAVLGRDVDKSWKWLFPAWRRSPVPLPVLLAMQTISLWRGWIGFAAAMGLLY